MVMCLLYLPYLSNLDTSNEIDIHDGGGEYAIHYYIWIQDISVPCYLQYGPPGK